MNKKWFILSLRFSFQSRSFLLLLVSIKGNLTAIIMGFVFSIQPWNIHLFHELFLMIWRSNSHLQFKNKSFAGSRCKKLTIAFVMSKSYTSKARIKAARWRFYKGWVLIVIFLCLMGILHHYHTDNWTLPMSPIRALNQVSFGTITRRHRKGTFLRRIN